MRWAAILLTAVAVAGCGSSSDDEPSAAQPAPSATPAAAEDQVAKVATDYVRAFAEGDFGAACALRSEKEQQKLEKIAGSCKNGLEATLQSDESRQSLEQFADLEATKVTVKGERAAVAMSKPDADTPAFVLVEIRQDNGWHLETASEAEAQKLLDG